MAWICGATYSNDVNIGNANFYGIDIKIAGKTLSLLDAKGTFLATQID